MFDDRRDSIQLTSLVSTVVDPDTQEKIAVIRDRLMRQFGYDEFSADRDPVARSRASSRAPRTTATAGRPR